jgi:Bacterial membrane protein YfhO
LLPVLGAVAVIALAALGAAGAARFVRRPIPPALLAAFCVLAALPFPYAFLGRTTPLPLDHVPLTYPWTPLAKALPYNFYLNDVMTLILPWTEAVRLAWRSGALPLFDRWNGCGMTLAANSVSAAFSPFTAPMLVLPLPAAFLGVGVAKLALAMAGTWLWACELGASRRASVLAGVAFGLSLTFSQWLFCPQTSVFCLWPWMLFFVECGRDPAIRRRARAALAATLAVQALAGHPESLALGVLFAVLWIALRWAIRDLGRGGRVLPDFVAAGAAAAALTAFLLLPSALAILASNRLVNAEIPHWTPLLSLAPHGPQWGGILTAVFPHALGDLVHEKVIAGATGAIPEMDLGFFGLVGWAAVLLVLRPGSRRPRTEWALLALLVCGLAVAVALWPFGEVFAFVPAIRNMFPLRFASWVPLAGSVAAAFEADRLAKDARERPRAVAVAAVLTLAFAGFAYGLYKALWLEHQAVGGVPFQRTETIVAIAVLFATALCWIAMRRHAAAAMAAVAVFAAADLLGHWHHIYRPSPTTLLYPETPMIRFLRSREGVFRVAGQGGALFQNSGVFAGVEDVRTNDGVERRDYVVFLNATCGYPPEDYFKHIRNVDAPVLDFLNVRYMVSPPDGKAPGTRWTSVYEGHDGAVYENAAVLPRAFVPSSVRLVAASPGLHEPVRDADAAFGASFAEIAAASNWRERAWVLADRDGDVPGGAGEVGRYAETTNAIAFQARVTSGPAYVVLSVVQDGGWSARDGRGAALEVRHANGPFMAVVLPQGEHAVTLTYRPPGFPIGSAISLAAAVALAGLALAASRGRVSSGGVSR